MVFVCFPMQRYHHYIGSQVTDEDIEPLALGQLDKFYSHVPAHLVSNKNYHDLREQLEKEILRDYHYSLRKAVVDYILLDSGEKERLNITALPFTSPRR